MSSDNDSRGLYWRFWNILCAFSPYLFIVFIIGSILFVLSLISLSMTSSGTGSYLILQIDIMILLTLLAATGYSLLRCRHGMRQSR